MIVLQVILGEVPEHLVSCIESVKSFAKRNGYKYEQVNTFPNLLLESKREKYLHLRTYSEHIRANWLASKSDLLVVDWDIFLTSKFEFKSCSEMYVYKSPHEAMIYTGDNPLVLEMPEEIKTGSLDLMTALTKVKMCKTFDCENALHLNNWNITEKFYW